MLSGTNQLRLGLIKRLGTLLIVNWLMASSTLEAKLYDPKTFSLPNGLYVVVLTNTRVPVVEHNLWYKVGSIDDPRGKSGLAHYLEHLMYTRTKKHGPGYYMSSLQKLGATFNAATSYDYTSYYVRAAKEHLPAIMALESDRMANLVISDKEALPERDVIIQERRMRYDNSPTGILQESALAAIYKHCPYQTPVIGWEHEMQTLTSQDAREFYQQWYTPSNAILVLAGDITVEEAKALTEKYYSKLESRPVPARKYLMEPRLQGVSVRLSHYSSQIELPALSRIYKAPNFKDARSIPLSLLSEILTGTSTSLLVTRLVEEQKILHSIEVEYEPDLKLPYSSISFTIRPRAEVSVEQAEAALQKEIDLLLAEGITDQELKVVIDRFLAKIDYLKDDSFGGAKDIGHRLVIGGALEKLEETPDLIKAVTKEQVNQAIKEVLSDKNHLTALLLPERKTQKIAQDNPPKDNREAKLMQEIN